VTWKFTQHDGLISLHAADPQTLAHQTWSLPRETLQKPVVVRGSATIGQDDDSWVVVAGEGNQLEIQARTSGK
jgi:hypothetical protein